MEMDNDWPDDGRWLENDEFLPRVWWRDSPQGKLLTHARTTLSHMHN